MPITEKRSRHERRPSGLLQRYNSIFDLAKAAEARRGSHDTTDSPLSSPTFASFSKSRNNSINHTIHLQPQSAKKPKYLTPPNALDFAAARLHYESSNESFSPTLSQFSDDDNASSWFSDVGTPYSVHEREHDYCTFKPLISEEEYERNMHRAAALAALEGRSTPVHEDDWSPLIRTSRSEYEDHVDAEHGQLQCLSPRPRRAAAKVQKDIVSWEENLAKFPPPVFGLGIITDSQKSEESSDDWVTESPLDLLNSRPVFYQQDSADDFWAEEQTLEQLNAAAIAAFSMQMMTACEV